MARHPLLLAIAGALTVSGCRGASTPEPRALERAVISDAAHAPGNPGFSFLPPMVPQPHAAGTFQRGLSPVVRIDEIDPGSGAALRNVVTFNTTSPVDGSQAPATWH